MGAFIRRHWVAYVVGALAALLFGFGLSYILGKAWSTPDEVRAAREAEDDEGQQGPIDFDADEAQPSS